MFRAIAHAGRYAALLSIPIDRACPGACAVPDRHCVSVVAVTFLVLLSAFGFASGASQAPQDITRGVWAGGGGPDTFLFELRGTPPDSMVGMVHVMRGGRMESQLAITRASYRPPDLEMYIASTNATYRGRVHVSRGRVDGGLTFGGQPGPEMDLRWMDPSGLPGFVALEGGAPYAYRKPADGIEGWQTATPEEVGLDRRAVQSLVNAVASDEAGLIHSLQIVLDGKLVVDEYFHGYGPDDLHRLASTTKSVSSLLVGAAIDRGLIAGVDVGLEELLGEPMATDPGWHEETLRDLLTMSMGLDWSPAEKESLHGTGPDFFRRVLARAVVTDPGSTWDYVSANVNLLAGAIFNATGEHAETFARKVLLEPLGIGVFDWEPGKEGGYNLMDGSLRLRPRDLAKIGAMVANGGRWNDRQVISENWIRESTRSHLDTGQPFGGYGYLWWTGELPPGQGSEPIVVANGMGSQFIVILPQLDMVVVTTGGNDNNGRHMDFGRVLAVTLLPTM
jgi:CubicO group peptidase (beta-lactamase class C family)